MPSDFPRDPSVDQYMCRTHDQFWGDMLWLYEHNFYLVGMNDVVSGNLDVPIGKHPVVFTFDDGSSLHFSYIEDANGELIIDPNCAVGIMERFYTEYPDFGRGAHFGLVPAHKFSWPQHEQDEYFDMKIEWLMANGYEVGNHTLSHPNLAEIEDDTFAWTVSGPVIWADATIGVDHPSNASRILTLPFGVRPKPDDDPHKVAMMTGGFEYEGNDIRLTGVLELTGGSSEVPWSNEWDPYSRPRLPVQEDVLEILKEVHLGGRIRITPAMAIRIPLPCRGLCPRRSGASWILGGRCLWQDTGQLRPENWPTHQIRPILRYTWRTSAHMGETGCSLRA
jgi:peptidoglycan/xylan/chitin deacetylase (PgdA/CDA1 family)